MWTMPTVRDRADLCPGVLRPWPADDGALVRIRLCGGLLTGAQLRGLSALAVEYGDGDVHLTKRANVQVRGICDADSFADEVEALGLLPSRSHELVRNIVVSPLSSLHALASEFDALLCADAELVQLPARFLFSFDDRGDLAPLRPDLGVYGDRLVVGGRLGDAVDLHHVPELLIELAHRFLSLRGQGPTAAWHVTELSSELAPADACYPHKAPPPQVDVPDGLLTPDLLASLSLKDRVIVTPWRGLILTPPDTARSAHASAEAQR